MNIGIDGYEANTLQRVGIGQYAFQLLKHIYLLDKKNNYTIFLPSIPLNDLPQERLGWKYVIGKPGSFWTIRQLPFLMRNIKLDVFFSPTHYIPWFTTVPCIMSVMDLSYLFYPELFKKKDLLQLKFMGKISIKRAQKILTISEFTKKEIIEHYHYPVEKITVTYPGLNPDFEKQSELKANTVLQKYGLKSLYILFIGTLQPRKNVEKLITAFDQIKHPELELVIIGKKGWLYEPILQRIKSAKKASLIKVLNFVPDSELRVFYENAECFVLPSLYEGFGIPVLEAMHFGCPVVVSQKSSLPEIAGEAAIYVNPLDVQDIAKGIEKAVQLKPEERRRLITCGYKQAEKYTWQKCAQNTIKAFEEFK